MPITLDFDSRLKLGTARYSGSVTLNDLQRYIEVWSRPEYHDYHELVIVEQGAGAEVEHLLQHLENVQPLDDKFSPHVCTAIVEVPNGESYGGFWRAAYQMNSSSSRKVELFSSEAQALAWLFDSRHAGGRFGNGK